MGFGSAPRQLSGGQPTLGDAVQGSGYTWVPQGLAGAVHHSPLKAVSFPFAVVI